mgnify:CR=1 FL=1
MANLTNDEIFNKLQETDENDSINELFDIINLKHQQNDIFYLLQLLDQDDRCQESKTLFKFLLNLSLLPKTQQINTINDYSRNLFYFLLDITDTDYLQNHFYFICCCIHHILNYFLSNNSVGQFLLISFQSLLMNFENIQSLSINTSDFQNINAHMTFIKEFIPLFDEGFLIWCYFEIEHSQFCQLIDQRKYPKPINDSARKIIELRMQSSSNFSLFNQFLSKLYINYIPITNNYYEVLNDAQLYEEDGYEHFSYRLSQESGFEQQELPFRPVRHRFKISESLIYQAKSPSSVPPPKKKAITLKLDPTVSLTLTPKGKSKIFGNRIQPRVSPSRYNQKNQDVKTATDSQSEDWSDQSSKHSLFHLPKPSNKDTDSSSVSESISTNTSEDYSIRNPVSPASNPITCLKKPRVQLKPPQSFVMQSDSKNALLDRGLMLLGSSVTVQRKKFGTLDIKKSDQSSDNEKKPK